MCLPLICFVPIVFISTYIYVLPFAEISLINNRINTKERKEEVELRLSMMKLLMSMIVMIFMMRWVNFSGFGIVCLTLVTMSIFKLIHATTYPLATGNRRRTLSWSLVFSTCYRIGFRLICQSKMNSFVVANKPGIIQVQTYSFSSSIFLLL